VERWQADSAVRRLTYHRTVEVVARAILRHGIDVQQSRVGTFGQGFYTSTEPDPFYGAGELVVAMRLRHPLEGHAWEIGETVDRVAGRLRPLDPRVSDEVARAIRRELVSKGNDKLVAHDAGGDGIDFVVASVNGVARVVIDS
jgi:hypothetical protein